MKATPRLHPLQLLPIAGIALGLGSLPGTTTGQESIVIEGGPNEVQISDRDGEIEELDEVKKRPDATVPSLPDPEAVTVQPVPDSNIEVRVPVEGESVEQGTEIPDVENRKTPDLESVNPELRERLDAMEKQLSIAVSGSKAQVNFTADDLFEKEETELREVSEDPLEQLGQYIEAYKASEVSIRYHYVADEETEQVGRDRSVQIANYLDEVTELDEEAYSIQDPTPVEDPIPQDGKPGQIVEVYKPVVTITMQ